MHPQTAAVTLGCLLEGIGMLACRATGSASPAGEAEAFFAALPAVPTRIRECACLPQSLSAEQWSAVASHPGCIVRAASRFASQRLGREPSAAPSATRALAPVFTHLNGEQGVWYLPPADSPDALPMPVKGEGRETPAQYQQLLRRLQDRLQGLNSADCLPAVLAAMEDETAGVAACAVDGQNDLSFFDQAKITAALGACISEYLLWQGQQDLYGALLSQDDVFADEPAFLLYTADFSGVQKFIYTVATKGALRSLRSRSFFLDFLMEHYVDELLTACGVSRANLLYSGGGHCYLLLPNTPAVREAADEWNTRMNDWLFRQFSGRLFLAHGYTPCTANELNDRPAGQNPYRAMFRRATAMASQHKLRRVSARQLMALNSTAAQEDGRECAICGRSDTLVPTRQRCYWCGTLEDISPKVQRGEVYLVSNDAARPCDFTLPSTEGTASVTLTDAKQGQQRLASGESLRRLYVRNQRKREFPNAILLYLGAYAASNEMEALAAGSSGIRRLAVCRMDVDNLGQAFVQGFEQPQQPEPLRTRYVSLARTAAFSRVMSLFFKRELNGLLSGAIGGGRALWLSVVYSGGDDVFLVGSWNDVIEGALRIRQALGQYTCGALTISGGVGLFDDHFPIRVAAQQTADLEDEAKQMPGKDALALFGEGDLHTYHWDVFRQKVLGEKLAELERFFGDAENQRGNSLLYNLLELLRQAQTDKLHLARYAYLLTRLQPPSSSPKADSYRAFSQRMYSWALTSEDRRQLMTAILLYVYEHREVEPEHDEG